MNASAELSPRRDGPRLLLLYKPTTGHVRASRAPCCTPPRAQAPAGGVAGGGAVPYGLPPAEGCRVREARGLSFFRTARRRLTETSAGAAARAWRERIRLTHSTTLIAYTFTSTCDEPVRQSRPRADPAEHQQVDPRVAGRFAHGGTIFSARDVRPGIVKNLWPEAWTSFWPCLTRTRARTAAFPASSWLGGRRRPAAPSSEPAPAPPGRSRAEASARHRRQFLTQQSASPRAARDTARTRLPQPRSRSTRTSPFVHAHPEWPRDDTRRAPRGSGMKLQTRRWLRSEQSLMSLPDRPNESHGRQANSIPRQGRRAFGLSFLGTRRRTTPCSAIRAHARGAPRVADDCRSVEFLQCGPSAALRGRLGVRLDPLCRGYPAWPSTSMTDHRGILRSGAKS